MGPGEQEGEGGVEGGGEKGVGQPKRRRREWGLPCGLRHAVFWGEGYEVTWVSHGEWRRRHRVVSERRGGGCDCFQDECFGE